MSASATTTGLIENATCLACGCLCDDIAVTVVDGRVATARNACERGARWFGAADPDRGLEDSTIEGRAAARDEALDRAAAVLAGARCPVIAGLAHTTIEGQRAAVALGDQLGATVDPGGSARDANRLAAFQRVGCVGATWGEVRARADVVAYVGADPAATHPRHFERFIDPPGRFQAARRTILVLDAARTETAARADHFLHIEPDRQFEALWSLIARVRGVPTRPLPGDAALEEWAERLRAARYGALVLGPGLVGFAAIQAAYRLARDLNVARRRFVAVSLGGAGNLAGAEAVLAWQTGFAASVDLSRGHPRFLPGEATLEARLARGEADAVLLLGPAPERIERVPSVLIAPDATAPARAATVGLASAVVGIETEGTVLRCDGVALPLRPVRPPTRPTAQHWLDALRQRLES